MKIELLFRAGMKNRLSDFGMSLLDNIAIEGLISGIHIEENLYSLDIFLKKILKNRKVESEFSPNEQYMMKTMVRNNKKYIFIYNFLSRFYDDSYEYCYITPPDLKKILEIYIKEYEKFKNDPQKYKKILAVNGGTITREVEIEAEIKEGLKFPTPAARAQVEIEKGGKLPNRQAPAQTVKQCFLNFKVEDNYCQVGANYLFMQSNAEPKLQEHSTTLACALADFWHPQETLLGFVKDVLAGKPTSQYLRNGQWQTRSGEYTVTTQKSKELYIYNHYARQSPYYRKEKAPYDYCSITPQDFKKILESYLAEQAKFQQNPASYKKRLNANGGMLTKKVPLVGKIEEGFKFPTDAEVARAQKEIEEITK